MKPHYEAMFPFQIWGLEEAEGLPRPQAQHLDGAWLLSEQLDGCCSLLWTSVSLKTFVLQQEDQRLREEAGGKRREISLEANLEPSETCDEQVC